MAEAVGWYQRVQLPPRPLGLNLLLAVVCLASPTRGFAQDEPRAFPPDEPTFPARLAGIDREWNLSFRAGGKVRVVAAKEIAYWGRYRDVETGPQVMLVDGGVIRADVLAMEEGQLILGDASGLARGQWEESSVRREAVRAVLFQPPTAADERDRLLLSLQNDRGMDDRLLLSGGEVVAGTLTAVPRVGRLAAETVPLGAETFELLRRGSAQPLAIPAAKVVAVSFGSVARPPPPTGMSAWLGLSDGSCLHAISISVKSGMVTIALAAVGELHAKLSGQGDKENGFWDSVSYIEPVGPRIQWLSDREAIGYKSIPFLSVQRPFVKNQSVLGTRLRAARAVFRQGLGTPSASRLAYDVAGFRRFQAELAIDETAGLKGSVVFKVLLAGASSEWQTAYESPILRGGESPVAISIDLKGASRMALLVDFADRGDECDYADWLQARLVR